MSSTKKNITSSSSSKKNATRKTQYLQKLNKCPKSKLYSMETYKVNCGKNLMLGFKSIKAAEETSLHPDEFVHVLYSKIKDYDKPVVIKVYDVNNYHLDIEKDILNAINGYRNTAKVICDFTCNDDKNNYLKKIKKNIRFCGNGGYDLLHFFVYEYIPYGDISDYFTKHKKDVNATRSIILQMVCVIIELATIYKINHGDLNSGNILIDKTNEKTLEYKIENQRFTIETFGVMPKIIDYGLSRFIDNIVIKDIWYQIIMLLDVIFKYVKDDEIKQKISNILRSHNRRFLSLTECYIHVRDNLAAI